VAEGLSARALRPSAFSAMLELGSEPSEIRTCTGAAPVADLA